MKLTVESASQHRNILRTCKAVYNEALQCYWQHTELRLKGYFWNSLSIGQFLTNACRQTVRKLSICHQSDWAVRFYIDMFPALKELKTRDTRMVGYRNLGPIPSKADMWRQLGDCSVMKEGLKVMGDNENLKVVCQLSIQIRDDDKVVEEVSAGTFGFQGHNTNV